MLPGIFRLVRQSINYYKRQVLYQVIIIALLSAVITGSLLTGRSVRASLKRTASERLGNTGFVISSGPRYFDASLAQRIRDSAHINCIGLLEMTGYCQNLITQKEALRTSIFAVTGDFFRFNGNDSVFIRPGEIAVNEKLADYLDLKAGDELIVRFRENSDIPADAPFAPAKEATRSVVLKIGMVLKSAGDFALGISQVRPMNIFINPEDIFNDKDFHEKINRLLIDNKSTLSAQEVYSILKKTLKPSDIGLSIRTVKKTGEQEIRSDRIFIDNLTEGEIRSALPSSSPVITYLGNRFSAGRRSTPYSFVSALPASLYPEIGKNDDIIINRWMAEDLAVREGDSLEMSWYSPDSLNKLIEKRGSFHISRIVEMNGIWADSTLMPDFPGISGSESCSGWDAGVPVKMNEIRAKDEDYWKKYKGTPKAFINYEKGIEIWGNNFGPATAIRFSPDISTKEIENKLDGSLDPAKTGFKVINLAEESVKAANESVDFSTLFLSLGFFLILASFVLLSFAVSSYFDSKQANLKTYFALGFKTRWIEKLLLTETGLIVFTGSLFGAFAGYLVNILIIGALNSVWNGAVQTSTLKAFFNFIPVLTGFLITLFVTMIFLLIKIRRFLSLLNRKGKVRVRSGHSPKQNLAILLTSFFFALLFFVLSVISRNNETTFSFISGSVLLISMIFFWRQYLFGFPSFRSGSRKKERGISRLFYSFYPSGALLPILFIATGIFAVFITGANRTTSEGLLKPSSGTGGYMFWCESSIPVKEDLNTGAGRREFGLDESETKGMNFVQAKRSSGDDASCLNLNHISAPPLLGINPDEFIQRKSFSFAKSIKNEKIVNPWQFLKTAPERNTIYGIADQTVLEWGLKIKPGDTLILRAENGQPLNVIIAAGLKSSVFQGYVLIGIDNFVKYFPSVSGSSVFLADGNHDLAELYRNTLAERFANYGINIEPANDRLAAFNEVENTYLSVFGVFGGLGMITGIAGLGFVLLRNYNLRKREFALMMAIGFSVKKIRRMIFSEQILILSAGVLTGVLPAIIATLPSLKNNPEIPWVYLMLMIFAILVTGSAALLISVRAVNSGSLTSGLKKE